MQNQKTDGIRPDDLTLECVIRTNVGRQNWCFSAQLMQLRVVIVEPLRIIVIAVGSKELVMVLLLLLLIMRRLMVAIVWVVIGRL